MRVLKYSKAIHATMVAELPEKSQMKSIQERQSKASSRFFSSFETQLYNLKNSFLEEVDEERMKEVKLEPGGAAEQL